MVIHITKNYDHFANERILGQTLGNVLQSKIEIYQTSVVTHVRNGISTMYIVTVLHLQGCNNKPPVYYKATDPHTETTFNTQ